MLYFRFHSKSRPARRKQSHISVVTISSSDDDESMARTAEWVASVAIEKEEISCPMEGINTDLELSHTKNRGGGETEEIQQQLSLLRFPTTQSEGSRVECSTSFTSTPEKNLKSACPQPAESEPFNISASEKYQISDDTGSVRSGLFCVRSSEKYQSPTFLGQRECLPFSSNASNQNLTANNSCRFSKFDPIVPSVQECRSFSSSPIENQQASTSEVRRSFCFVTLDKNRATQSSSERRPFCTITTDSHSVPTPSVSEEKRLFHLSTPVKHYNSPVEEQSTYCFMSRTKEQVPQECKPLCSSTPENLQNRYCTDILKRNNFCNITIEKQQESKQVHSQGQRNYCFGNPDAMEIQSSPEVVLGTPSIAMESSIFSNPQNWSKTPGTLGKPLIFSTSMQVEKDKLEPENTKQYYFGSYETQDPPQQLPLSNMEENAINMENSSISSYECSISGIEQISIGNSESPQESMTAQEAETEKPESSQNSDDEHSLLNHRNNWSQNYDSK